MKMSRGTDVSDMKKIYSTPVNWQPPEQLVVKLTKKEVLRYGENPHMPGAIYEIEGNPLSNLINIRLLETKNKSDADKERGKKLWSAINYMDAVRAIEILKYFTDPAVTVMKHLIPSGFSKKQDAEIDVGFAVQRNGKSLDNLYLGAKNCDPRAAFGGTVVSNKPIDKATAEAIISSYNEVIVAPEFEEGVTEIFENSRWKNLRLVLYSNIDKLPKFEGDDVEGIYSIIGLPNGTMLVQKPYLSRIKSIDDFIKDPMIIRPDGGSYVVNRDPTQRELQDLLVATYVNIGVRSNGIVIVKDGETLAVGTGQQERVGAVEQAVVKAYQKAMDRVGIKYNPIDGAANRYELIKQFGNPLLHAVLSSDGLFPKKDNIEVAADSGISAVAQPGGSIEDYIIIDEINKRDMAMVVTGERMFVHI